jgi:hypothetical protein
MNGLIVGLNVSFFSFFFCCVCCVVGDLSRIEMLKIFLGFKGLKFKF